MWKLLILVAISVINSEAHYGNRQNFPSYFKPSFPTKSSWRVSYNVIPNSRPVIPKYNHATFRRRPHRFCKWRIVAPITTKYIRPHRPHSPKVWKYCTLVSRIIVQHDVLWHKMNQKYLFLGHKKCNKSLIFSVVQKFHKK